MAIQTVAEMVKADTTKPADKVVAIMYNGQSAAQTNQEVWKSLALLFVREDVSTMEDLEDLFNSSIPESLLEVAPTRTVKKGKGLEDESVITWRSWEITKNTWKYSTYVCKAVAKHGMEVVFPKDAPLPSIGAVKDLAYGKDDKKGSTKSDFEKFQIALNNMATAFGKLEGQDKDSAKVLLDTTFNTLVA